MHDLFYVLNSPFLVRFSTILDHPLDYHSIKMYVDSKPGISIDSVDDHSWILLERAQLYKTKKEEAIPGRSNFNDVRRGNGIND